MKRVLVLIVWLRALGIGHTRLRVCGRAIYASQKIVDRRKLALRWRADGNEPTNTSITLMGAHLIYIGKSVGVGSGPGALRGLENRRPKGYAG